MSALSWWRSWHGAPTDHKWAVIAARSGAKVGVVSAIAWALLDYASQHIDRGTVDGFDTEEYAVYSGFSEDEIKAVIKAMTDKGIITDGRLTNWEKRQPKREDDSNERVRKFREKKRSVTHGNAPDKDTDTDKELSNGATPESEQPEGDDEMRYNDPVWDLLHGETPTEQQEHGPDIEWAAPDVQELAAVFMTATSLPAPIKRSSAKYWNVSLQEMRKQGITGDLIRQAVQKMRGDQLTIKDPGSVRAVALDIKVCQTNGTGRDNNRLLPDGV